MLTFSAAAIMASLKIQPFNYGNVALIAATGLVNLSNALGASQGGGSISGGSSGGSAQAAQEQSSFEPETSSLDVSGQDPATGSEVLTIRFETDGDDLAEALASSMTAIGKRQ